MANLHKNADIALFAGAAFLLLIGFSLYYVQLAGAEGFIIIHFLGGRGADFLGEKSNALHMLFAGSVMAILNAFIAAALYTRNRALARLTAVLTALIALLIVIALSCIIAVN